MSMQTLIRCPNCGSQNITYNPQKEERTCLNCGHKFKVEETE